MAPEVTLGKLFWILNEHSALVWEKKLRVHFLFICVFRKYMFCVQLYGKWACWGRYNLYFEARGGQTWLPEFKFSAKFPIGLHVILQIQIKKFENDCYIMWKIILTENPSRFMLNPSWNNVKWILFCKLYGITYAVHVTVALVGVATLNLALPAPPVEALKGLLLKNAP